jgi:hypothetical protein
MAACSSSTQSVTAPSTTKCAVTAAAAPTTFPAAGGKGTVTISTNRDCQWTASAAASWIQLGESAGGQGDSTVDFTVGANADPSARMAAIAVGDQQVGITQDAAACSFTVNTNHDSIAAAGGQRAIHVTASSGKCTWTARSDADWLTIAAGAQGSGNGDVNYEARMTTGPARDGTLEVAGQRVTVSQASGCRVAIAPASQSFATAGGPGNISVTTTAGCTWSAASDAPWLAITSGASGSGAGMVAFSVEASEMGIPARTGTIAIGEQAFTASQAAGPPCTYTIDAQSQYFPASPAYLWSFAITTGRFCSWTVSSNVPWVTINNSPKGTGDGVVLFNVAVNPPGGLARVGLISLQTGQSFTVFQNASP